MPAHLTLLELNTMIRDVVQDYLPETFWVIAEISELKVNRTGHCYLELIEKDSVSDEIVARSRAIIWSYTFRMLRPYFLTTTGQEFSEGIKVLVQVSVEFHAAYGLSLNIKDIDPTYTVGDLVRRRREIIERLKEAGVFDMNRELPLPLVPQRIAVISSATAAGYQDFVAHLEKNPFHFRFHHNLFQAYMQGAESVPSILHALDQIFENEGDFDAVVIIRGGGAQADLGSFDNFELAWRVAQFPIPVITGIGHEKDDTIIDLVAHTKLKTPTAVAEFFISGISRFYDKIVHLQNEVMSGAREILDNQSEMLNKLAAGITFSSDKYLSASRLDLTRIVHRYRFSVSRLVTVKTENLHSIRSRLSKYSTLMLHQEHNLLNHIFRDTRVLGKSRIAGKILKLDQLKDALPVKVKSFLNLSLIKLSASEAALRLLDPQNVLLRGFTLTLQNSKIVKSANEVTETFPMETRFHDGSVFSQISKK